MNDNETRESEAENVIVLVWHWLAAIISYLSLLFTLFYTSIGSVVRTRAHAQLLDQSRRSIRAFLEPSSVARNTKETDETYVYLHVSAHAQSTFEK